MAEKITKIKDPSAQARGKKAWKTQLEKIKAQHLEEIKNGKETSSTGTDTPNTGSSTPSSSTDTGAATPSSSTATPSSTNRLIILGLVGIIGIAGIYIFNIKKTPEKQITENPQKKPKTYM